MVEHMRLQAYLTPENEVAVQQLLASVNAERAKAGLEPATISSLVNEIISRIDQMSSLNICGVYLMNRQDAAPLPVEPLKRDRKAHAQNVAILETQEPES